MGPGRRVNKYRVRAYVGDRETGEVLRKLILSALPPEPETAE